MGVLPKIVVIFLLTVLHIDRSIFQVQQEGEEPQVIFVFKVLTWDRFDTDKNNIVSFEGPIGLAAIQVIMYVSTFKTAVILYVFYVPMECDLRVFTITASY